MNKPLIIQKTANYVQSTLQGEGSGHDWWHIKRVWNNALLLANNEEVDIFVVELAALLHDIADYKFHGGDTTIGPKVAKEWLETQDVQEEVISHVCKIIESTSFKGSEVNSKVGSKEAMIVQDADRLDAIGAIGIGRCFAYGGNKNREMYNPNIKPIKHTSFEEYKSNTNPTINHFYEKLLLLKSLMNTDKAKEMAQERHLYMEEFLDRFFKEWDGEK